MFIKRPPCLPLNNHICKDAFSLSMLTTPNSVCFYTEVGRVHTLSWAIQGGTKIPQDCQPQCGICVFPPGVHRATYETTTGRPSCWSAGPDAVESRIGRIDYHTTYRQCRDSVCTESRHSRDSICRDSVCSLRNPDYRSSCSNIPNHCLILDVFIT